MKIALIDKHPLLRKGLIAELHSNFTGLSVAEYDQLAGLPQLNVGFAADIVVIGLDQLAVDSPAELMQLTRRLYPVASVIILDYTLNPAMAHFYLSEGVMGYVSKDAPATELINCVRLVMEGKRHMSTEMLIWMLRESKSRPYGNREGNSQRPMLTRDEMEIAICIANGMPVRWIADSYHIKQNRINMIKSTIFRKLGVGSTIQLRRLLRSYGR